MPSSMAANRRTTLTSGDAPLLKIETYAGFTRLCSKKVDGKPGARPALINPAAKGDAAGRPDPRREQSPIGNHRSIADSGRLQRTPIASPSCDVVPALRHTVLPQPASAVAAPAILDSGYSLGKTLGAFRSVFFTTQR